MSHPENLSPQESLDLITRMIRQTQVNLRHSSFYFLLWGWVITLANIGMYILIKMDYERPYLVWTIAIPAWLLSFYYGYKQDRAQRVITHFDKISMWLWISYGISIFILVFFGQTIQWNLNPVIFIFTAIPTLVSGVILKFKPLVFGGVSFWVFGIICFLIHKQSVEYQYLLGAVALICGYLVPGYMLRNKQSA